MAAKICIEPGCTRRQDPTMVGPEMCEQHNDFYAWENTHNDEAHDDEALSTPEERDMCPICKGVDPASLNPKARGTRKIEAKTAHRSHANCNHPRTPRDRAACRKAGGPKA